VLHDLVLGGVADECPNCGAEIEPHHSEEINEEGSL